MGWILPVLRIIGIMSTLRHLLNQTAALVRNTLAGGFLRFGFSGLGGTVGEDACRVRKDDAAGNLSAIRKFALSALRTNTRYADRSLRRRRKLADHRPEYRAELLGIKIPKNG